MMCGLRLCRSAVVKVPTDPLLLTPPQDCIARGDLALLLLQVFFEVRCCSFFDRLMQLVIVSAWSLAKFKPTAGAPPRTILLWYNYTRLSNTCDFNSFIRPWQVGWHGAKGRRGGALGLLVKDPMDGHQVRAVTAPCAIVFALTLHTQTALATLQIKVEDHRRQRIVLFNTVTKDWFVTISAAASKHQKRFRHRRKQVPPNGMHHTDGCKVAFTSRLRCAI